MNGVTKKQRLTKQNSLKLFYYNKIGVVRYKRNNVELPPLLQNDVFQKIISSDV
jgi:hypothetical protein